MTESLTRQYKQLAEREYSAGVEAANELADKSAQLPFHNDVALRWIAAELRATRQLAELDLAVWLHDKTEAE